MWLYFREQVNTNWSMYSWDYGPLIILSFVKLLLKYIWPTTVPAFTFLSCLLGKQYKQTAPQFLKTVVSTRHRIAFVFPGTHQWPLRIRTAPMRDLISLGSPGHPPPQTLAAVQSHHVDLVRNLSPSPTTFLRHKENEKDRGRSTGK